MSTFEESFRSHWDSDVATLAHESDRKRAPYDPVKAHEYYIRTRKLKGKRKKQKTPDAVKKEYQGKLTKFLGSLPMAKGGDLKKTAAFVNKMRKMTDDEMVAAAKKLSQPESGSKVVSQEAMAQMGTINALLQNRSRVRASKGTGSKKRVTPKVHEDGSVSYKSVVPKAKKPQSGSSTTRVGATASSKRSSSVAKMAPEKKTTTQKLAELAARKEAEQRKRTG